MGFQKPNVIMFSEQFVFGWYEEWMNYHPHKGLWDIKALEGSITSTIGIVHERG